MMYDRDKYRKLDDKKKLIKSHKRWLVASTALLGAIGMGGAMATAVNADAVRTAPQAPVATAHVESGGPVRLAATPARGESYSYKLGTARTGRIPSSAPAGIQQSGNQSVRRTVPNTSLDTQRSANRTAGTTNHIVHRPLAMTGDRNVRRTPLRMTANDDAGRPGSVADNNTAKRTSAPQTSVERANPSSVRSDYNVRDVNRAPSNNNRNGADSLAEFYAGPNANQLKDYENPSVNPFFSADGVSADAQSGTAQSVSRTVQSSSRGGVKSTAASGRETNADRALTQSYNYDYVRDLSRIYRNDEQLTSGGVAGYNPFRDASVASADSSEADSDASVETSSQSFATYIEDRSIDGYYVGSGSDDNVSSDASADSTEVQSSSEPSGYSVLLNGSANSDNGLDKTAMTGNCLDNPVADGPSNHNGLYDYSNLVNGNGSNVPNDTDNSFIAGDDANGMDSDTGQGSNGIENPNAGSVAPQYPQYETDNSAAPQYNYDDVTPRDGSSNDSQQPASNGPSVNGNADGTGNFQSDTSAQPSEDNNDNANVQQEPFGHTTEKSINANDWLNSGNGQSVGSGNDQNSGDQTTPSGNELQTVTAQNSGNSGDEDSGGQDSGDEDSGDEDSGESPQQEAEDSVKNGVNNARGSSRDAFEEYLND